MARGMNTKCLHLEEEEGYKVHGCEKLQKMWENI